MTIVVSYFACPSMHIPMIVSMNIVVIDPVAVDSVVVTAQSAAVSPCPAPLIARVLPGLNPYHPNQRMKVLRTLRVTECAGKVKGSERIYPSAS